MFHFIGKPSEVDAVAVSGGIDSMVLLDFINNCHDVTVLHFDHGTEFGAEARKFVEDYCESWQIPIICGRISSDREGRSLEEWWRDERYAFLEKFNGIVATAHHLNDVAETYLFSAIHGTPKIIPQSRNNVVRPLLATPKSAIEDWADNHSVPYLHDPSNSDTNRPRNRIRMNIMPQIEKINPGFLKVVKKIGYAGWMREKNEDL
jgi:tRNA(Ile)-lysidine synthase